MTAKRTMTLNLTDAEMRALDDLSARKDSPRRPCFGRPSAFTRRSRLVSKRARSCFRERGHKEKAELMLL